MSLQNPYILGLFLVGVGLALWFIARLALSKLARSKPVRAVDSKEQHQDLEKQTDAVLLIKQGGLGVWASPTARKLFHLSEKQAPNIEKLARQIRQEDDFLRLCAGDNNARLTINDVPFEANAFSVNFAGEHFRVITFRDSHLGIELSGEYGDLKTSSALHLLKGLTEKVTINLDLDAAMQAIFENIERLLSIDTLDICLRDARKEAFLTYRLERGENGKCFAKQNLVLSTLDESYLNTLVNERKPLLIQDVDPNMGIQANSDHKHDKLRSLLGIPLLVGGEVVGALQAGTYTRGSFQQHDLNLLVSLSNQIAIALRNSLQYGQEKRRAAELNGLAQLTQAFGSIRNPKELFERLMDCIAPMVPVSILGFLIYNENSRVLEGRRPFIGLPSDFIEMYQVPIPTGSLFEQVYLEKTVIQSQNAVEDPRWIELGLYPIAAAASLQDTVLVPLVSGGKMLGYLQASNYIDGNHKLSADDLHLLKIIASQVSPIIENANLFQQLTLRAQRAETLRRINSLTSSAAGIDEILQQTLKELSRFLQADFASVFLINKDRTSLQLHQPSYEYDLDGIPGQLLNLAVEDVQYPFTAAGSMHTIYSGKVLPEKPLVPFYRQWMEALKFESLVIAPLVVHNEGIGEIWICSQKPDTFETGDLQVLNAAAAQLAGVVEHALDDHTEDLRREHHRLQTMLKVSNELSASLDIQQVLQRSLGVINEAIGAQESMILMEHSGGLFRMGELLPGLTEDNLVDKFPLTHQIGCWVTRERSSIIVDDLKSDTRWEVPTGDSERASSLLGIPLILGEEVLGSMLLLHSQPSQFQVGQIELLEAIARQIASTLKNTELFNLIRDQSENLGGMLRDQQIEASRSRAILEAVADGVVVTDTERKITLVNASAERILGIETDQLNGQTFDFLQSLIGEAGQDWLNTIQQWSLDHSSVREGQTYAVQVNLDSRRVVAIHVAPVIWRSSFLGTVSIFRDITHQVQVDRLKSEFITNVSHELRTPLTSIKGYADIMLMGAAGEMSDQQTHFLNVVKENALRLQGLVDDLLDVSHIQAGRIVIDYQAVDLASIAEEVIAEMRQLTSQENKPFNFNVDIQPGLARAHGDRERTKQIMRSLALNGFKYTPENGEVTIRIHQNGSRELQVDVLDNGIGISLDDQPRIFERFFRGEHPLVMATAGTGLGLALAKILVEMQDGRIWFESSGSGKGSTFSFTLPSQPAEV